MDQRLERALTQLGDSFNKGYDRLTERVDDLEARLNMPGRPLDSDGRREAEAKALSAFNNSGEPFKNSLSIGDDTAGGYTVTPAISTEILAKQHDSAPMLSHVRVVEMATGSSFQEPVDTSDAEANWVGEAETRQETSAGNFQLNETPLHECDALVKSTSRLYEDSPRDMAGYIIDKVSARFGRLIDQAIVSGSGVKMPKGFLTYATSVASDNTRAAQTYQHVVSGNATSLTADAILNLTFALRAPYRQKAAFVMNSDTARQLRLLRDGNGQYLWQQGLASDTPDTLAGKPVVYDENMPQVAAGAFPIAFADWKRAYVIVRRAGVKWLRDPYSQKPFILLYATQRVGGQASGDFDALKLLKISA
jgi:HK97 family phage major capsid protein